MGGVIDMLVVLGLFTLRLVIPLALTFLVGYIFVRLDAKWEAEAEAQWEQEQETKALAYWPQVQERAQQATLLTGVTAGPRLAAKPTCRALKAECDGEKCAACPASKQPALPCWLARQQAEGQMPEECFTCELFLPQPDQAGRLM